MTNATGHDRRRLLRGRALAPVAFAIALGLVPAPAALMASPGHAQGLPADPLRTELADHAPGELRPFYSARGWQPLWLDGQGRVRQAAFLLLGQVEQAEADGIKPSRVKAGELRKALDHLGNGDLRALARIELAASKVYAGWVKALRAAPHAPVQYESEALAPVVRTTTAALQAAAAAPSLETQLRAMAWMHPWYAPLRTALLSGALNPAQRHRIALNMDRLRAIPPNPARYVLVDAAGARLWMFEGGKPVDSMRVVVGKPDNQTPAMAGFIRSSSRANRNCGGGSCRARAISWGRSSSCSPTTLASTCTTPRKRA